MLDTLELTKRLISFRPVSADLDNVNNATSFLSNYLQEAGVNVAVHDFQGRTVIYASRHLEKVSKILLNAHLDIVPPEKEEQLEVETKDGWLYGRGVLDCLGNAAVIANILCELPEGAPVGAIFSTDEEIGGFTTDHMIKLGYTATDMIIIMDISDYYKLGIAQKGVISLKLTAHGKACHAAEPWTGTNAIDILINNYLKIKEMFPVVSTDNQWQPTMAATVINAGTAGNRVPEQAELVLNIRFTETQTAGEIITKIKETCNLDVTIQMTCDPFCVNEDNETLQKALSFMSANLPKPLEVVKMNGATDARYFARENVPIILLGLPGHGPHSVIERIEEGSPEIFKNCIKQMLSEFV